MNNLRFTILLLVFSILTNQLHTQEVVLSQLLVTEYTIDQDSETQSNLVESSFDILDEFVETLVLQKEDRQDDYGINKLLEGILTLNQKRIEEDDEDEMFMDDNEGVTFESLGIDSDKEDKKSSDDDDDDDDDFI